MDARKNEGIPLDESVIESLNKLAEKVGVAGL